MSLPALEYPPEPEQPEVPPRPHPWRRMFKIAKWVLFAFVLVMVVRAIGKQLQLIDFHSMRLNPWPLLGATAALVMVPIIQLISYRTLLGAYAHRPPWSGLAASAWISMLGKYVPGKLASFAGTVYFLRRYQIPAAIAISVVLVLDGLMVVTGLIVGAPLLGHDAIERILPHGEIICIMLIIAGAICLHPRIYSRLVNIALKQMGRQPLDHMPPLRIYLLPVICGFLQWLFVGLMLWFLCLSVGHVPASQIPTLISVSGLAYTVSYMALFAPGGLGVREAILLTSLKAVLGPGAAGAAAIVVVGSRLLQILVEVSIAGVGMLILKFSADNQSSLPSPGTPGEGVNA